MTETSRSAGLLRHNFEEANQRLMENADGGLKHAEQGRGAEGPAVWRMTLYSWTRLSEQFFRFDKWSLRRG